MVTTLRSVIGWSATIGACVLVTLFSLSGTGVRAYAEECMPEEYDTLDVRQQEVVSTLVERIDRLIGKRPEMIEKIVTVFDTMSSDDAMNDTKKAVLVVLRDYYQNIADGVCEQETTETSLRQQLLQGLGTEEGSDGQDKKREKPGVGWGSGGNTLTGAALCNERAKPEVRRGCKVVPVRNTEKKCIDLTVVCDNAAPIGTGSSGTGENDGVCIAVPKPAEKDGCVIRPVRDRKGCVSKYEYVCKQEKSCRDSVAPIPPEGCTVSQGTDRRGCVSFKVECPDDDNEDDQDEDSDEDDDGSSRDEDER